MSNRKQPLAEFTSEELLDELSRRSIACQICLMQGSTANGEVWKWRVKGSLLMQNAINIHMCLKVQQHLQELNRDHP